MQAVIPGPLKYIEVTALVALFRTFTLTRRLLRRRERRHRDGRTQVRSGGEDDLYVLGRFH